MRVRMGLHTGTPHVTSEGYLGFDVHRAARIAAIGHGGQVLLSASTAVLVDTELRDLGEHRLKDLAQPERIFQLVIDDLPNEFPVLQTLDRIPNNLPTQITTFIGALPRPLRSIPAFPGPRPPRATAPAARRSLARPAGG